MLRRLRSVWTKSVSSSVQFTRLTDSMNRPIFGAIPSLSVTHVPVAHASSNKKSKKVTSSKTKKASESSETPSQEDVMFNVHVELSCAWGESKLHDKICKLTHETSMTLTRSYLYSNRENELMKPKTISFGGGDRLLPPVKNSVIELGYNVPNWYFSEDNEYMMCLGEGLVDVFTRMKRDRYKDHNYFVIRSNVSLRSYADPSALDIGLMTAVKVSTDIAPLGFVFMTHVMDAIGERRIDPSRHVRLLAYIAYRLQNPLPSQYDRAKFRDYYIERFKGENRSNYPKKANPVDPFLEEYITDLEEYVEERIADTVKDEYGSVPDWQKATEYPISNTTSTNTNTETTSNTTSKTDAETPSNTTSIESSTTNAETKSTGEGSETKEEAKVRKALIPYYLCTWNHVGGRVDWKVNYEGEGNFEYRNRNIDYYGAEFLGIIKQLVLRDDDKQDM